MQEIYEIHDFEYTCISIQHTSGLGRINIFALLYVPHLQVRWPNGVKGNYRFGHKNKYDLFIW